MEKNDDTAAMVLAAFEGRDRELRFEIGDVLVNEGDVAQEVFVVLAGRFEAVRATDHGAVVVGSVGPGEILGEIAVIAGGRRNATLRATESSVVRAIDRMPFERWLIEHGAITDEVSRRARERIDRTQVAEMLTGVLGVVEPELVAEIVHRCEWRRLAAGEVLFAQGDLSDAAYFVVGGRVRASVLAVAGPDDESPGEVVIGELGRGEVVGELGLIDDAPRSATIRAVRDTTLARFPAEMFDELIQRSPALMLQVTRNILRRIRSTARRGVSRASTLTLVVTTDGIDPEVIASMVHDEIGRFRTAALLSARSVDEFLDRPGIAQTDADNVGAPRLSEFLHEAEVTNEHLVLLADPTPTAWTRRAMRQADRVVVIMSAQASVDEEQAVRALVDELDGHHNVARTVALVHPADTDRPRHTARVLDTFGFHDVVHLRRDVEEDVRRMARLASGHGVGLVLSGGGGRGLGHIGVHRALIEAGVPIDYVAGCSMGSIIAGAIAQGHRPGEVEELIRRQTHRMLDYTIPIVSILTGKRVSASIESSAGTWDIEDLWLPFYCTSTNLSRSRSELHRRGDLARAIRASVAIPGVLPPVSHHGDLLVDGGVLNNMPFEPLRDDVRVGTLIAVDVSPANGPSAPDDLGLWVSGWRELFGRLRRSPRAYPGVANVLLRSMLTGATLHQQAALRDGGVDLLVKLVLPGVGLLDLERVAEVADAGYRASVDQVQSWAESTWFTGRATSSAYSSLGEPV
jgi:predicted acylesterase/phospholipase RssA/CRP-like cAMP-binding protein